MLVYSLFRAVLVSETLSEYGIRPWLFLMLDVGSALPLAWGQLRLVQALRARNPGAVQRSLAVVIVAFSLPYLYLLLGAGKPLPQVAYWIIGTLFAGMGVSSVWRIRQEARRSRLVAGLGDDGESSDA